ncbi:protein FAM204A-like [Dendronephthya gigantea]|uniref:protein FAM204A-like n=1 Tax=Dendronephthya gigantea TaxID=151771 RepID=UPI00106A16BB|nr:protein FAM204A-like [Dendronephthya gigantea]
MYSQVAPPESISFTEDEERDVRENLCEQGKESLTDKHLKEKPSNVAAEKWLKFQKLKERRQEMCKALPEKTRRKRPRKTINDDDACSSQTVKKSTREILKDNREPWSELSSNIDANIHLNQDSTSKQKSKSKLEERLDEALMEGNFSEAEKLSDEISEQELSVKIADAIEVREYKKQKELEEKLKKSKKKKKLLWGFEQKEKWESKGNM